MAQRVSPKRNLVKSVTWRIVGAIDMAAISWILTGNPFSGLKMGVGDILLKFIFYYIHERLWVNENLNKFPQLKNSRKRHLIKTITWRLFSTALNVILAWIILGKPLEGITISLIEIVVNSALYYFHERIWHRSNFGIIDDQKEQKDD